MKILVCSLTYPLPNGVTSSINTSVDRFIEAGHDVRIVAPEYPEGKIRPNHFPVPSSLVGRAITRYFGKKERMFSLTAGRAIKEIAEDFQPDAYWLHTVTWAPNAFEKIMLASDRPKILTYHTMVDMYGKFYAGALGEQKMIHRSRDLGNQVDEIITPSNFMAHKLKTFGVRTKISVVPTGIDPVESYYTREELSKKFDIPSDHKILLFVGRVVKEKNVGFLVQALARIVKAMPSVTLLMIGPGEIESVMEEARQLGVADRVVCPGQLPLAEARKCYGGADVFTFASQSETQGLVVSEAMIAGVPVVALISPIQPEFYPESVAIVVKDRQSFATKVIEVLQDDQLHKELGELGQQFVRSHFSTEGMLQKQLSVFIENVAKKQSRERI